MPCQRSQMSPCFTFKLVWLESQTCRARKTMDSQAQTPRFKGHGSQAMRSDFRMRPVGVTWSWSSLSAEPRLGPRSPKSQTGALLTQAFRAASWWSKWTPWQWPTGALVPHPLLSSASLCPLKCQARSCHRTVNVLCLPAWRALPQTFMELVAWPPPVQVSP